MIEARYDPAFTYVWDLLETWLPEPVAQGRATPREEVIDRIVRRYLSVVSYASLPQIERLLEILCPQVEEAVIRLQEEGLIERDVMIDGLPGRWVVRRDPPISRAL